MKLLAYTLLFSAISLMFTCVGVAHHSISAEFDGNQHIFLSGTITKVAWINPHSFFYVDVKDAKTGNVVNWSCELGSPNMLGTLGWNRATLRVGMPVSLTGILARDGSHRVIARNIIANGNRLVAWPRERAQ